MNCCIDLPNSPNAQLEPKNAGTFYTAAICRLL